MRRRMTAVAALSSLALLVAGCSSGGSSSSTSSAPATTEASTSASASAESSSAAPGGATLTIWADEVRTPPIKAECDKFAAENGITCDVVQIDFGDIRTRVVQGSQTGDVPDVFIGAHDWLGELVTNGVVTPVDLGSNAASFSSVAVQGVTYEGKTYGVPYAVENVAMLTNAKLSPDCPTSMDALIAAGKKLKDSGKASLPVALQIGDQGDAYHWYPMYSAQGGYIFGDGGTNVADMGVGKPGSIAAAEQLQEMAKAGLLKASVTGDIAKESYDSGKSAWFITGPWNANDAVEAIPSTMVCPVPNGTDTSQPFIGVQTFFIPTKAKNSLIAQTFLNDYVMTTSFMDAMYAADPRPPAWTASAEKITDPITQGFIKYGQQGIPQPSVPEMGAVWESLGLAEFRVASGADPATTMKEAGAAITKAINAAQ